jgi:4-diphosphocytidyl-2-C-methyl-D-erythritol kinase
MPVICEFAPAKINLTLQVLGRRADGYHDLESLIAFAHEVGDEVFFNPGEAAGVEVHGPFAASIAGENLIDVALSRLAEAEPRLALGRVVLDKQLPVAAGIGGGSADAAAVLRAVRNANPDLATSVDWQGIAAALGADVPVCLRGGTAFVSGMGERMQVVADLPRLDVVLVNALASVPADKTARVFARLAAGSSRAPGKPTAPAPRFDTADALIDHMRATGNDLLAAAQHVVPETAAVLAQLGELSGCRLACLSGAGPTCYGIFAGPAEAAAARSQLHQKQPGWWVAEASLGG